MKKSRGRPKDPHLVDPFWGMAPMSSATLQAVDGLADPPFPDPRWVLSPEEQYYYNPLPATVREWHRLRVLELAYAFHTEGKWNETEMRDVWGMIQQHDPLGAPRLWLSVAADVEQGRGWRADPKQAPLWYLAALLRQIETAQPTVIGVAARRHSDLVKRKSWAELAAAGGELFRWSGNGNNLKEAFHDHSREAAATDELWTRWTNDFSEWTKRRSHGQS